MKAIIKCSECGKVLGEYIGEDFYILHIPALEEGKPRILCTKCYEEEMGRNGEITVTRGDRPGHVVKLPKTKKKEKKENE